MPRPAITCSQFTVTVTNTETTTITVKIYNYQYYYYSYSVLIYFGFVHASLLACPRPARIFIQPQVQAVL